MGSHPEIFELASGWDALVVAGATVYESLGLDPEAEGEDFGISPDGGAFICLG